MCYHCNKRIGKRLYGLSRLCAVCWVTRVRNPYRTKYGVKLIMPSKNLSQYMHDKNRRRKIHFLGRQYYCSFDIRRDKCSRCGVDDKHTEIHHWFYLPIMMWSCIEELCDACHNAITQATKICTVVGRGNKVERLTVAHTHKGRPMKYRPLGDRYAREKNRICEKKIKKKF